MKSIFEIKDQDNIDEVLQSVEYGTLAICFENRPYSVPLNFVKFGESIYFHGSKSGKKMKILEKNPLASFSVVESCSIIPSYFSSKENLACPATQFFKSVTIDGNIVFVDDYGEKTEALSALMKKLQKEGRYKDLNEAVYKKAIDATTIYKLVPKTIRAKFKLGQHLSQERFDMIIENLGKRGTKKDLSTMKLMKKFKKDLA
ncbi:MAG: pyridoxamine 5'-phosphate oxidase family protein [Sulfurospirillum sp.]